MIVNSIFEYDSFHFFCNNNLVYQNTKLQSNIDTLLNLPLVVNRTKGGKYDSVCGTVLTSVGNEESDIVYMPGAEDLVTWITEKILETSPTAKSLEYKRSWVNKMFKYSQGLVHAHVHPDYKLPPVDFVAIFYLQVPEHGSDLIFVRDGEFNTLYLDYTETDRVHIKCSTGDLVVHSPYAYHAVSQHNSTIPRICLVFEGMFVG
jgi:hypothetical protein